MSGLVGMATPGHRTEMQTIADIELGSFASDFDAEAEEERKLSIQNGTAKGVSGGGSSSIGGPLREKMIPEPAFSSAKPATSSSADHFPSKPIPTATSSNSARRTPASHSSATSEDEDLDNVVPHATPRPKINSRRRNMIRPNASDIDVTGDDSAMPSRAGPTSLSNGGSFPQIGNETHEGDSDDLMSQSQVDIGMNPPWGDDDAEEGVGKNGIGKGPTAALKDLNADRPSSRASARRRGTDGAESLRESVSNERMEPALTLRDQQAQTKKLMDENFEFKALNVQLTDALQRNMDWADGGELQLQILKYRAMLAARASEMSQLNKIIKKQQQGMEAQEDELKRLRAWREKLGKAGPQANVGALEAQLREASKRERMDRDAREDLEDEIARLRSEIEELRSRGNESNSEELEKLQNQLDDADCAEKRRRDELDEKEGMIDDLQAELAAMTDERDRLMEDLDTKALDSERNLGPKLEQLETTNRSLQDELEHHKSRLQNHVSERTQHVEQITRLREEVNKLNAAQSDMHRTASRADNLQFEADSLDRAVRERDEEIRRLKEDVDRLMAEHHEIVDDKDQQSQETERMLTEEVRRVDAICAEAEQQLALKDKDVAQMAEALEECQRRLQELEQALADSEADKAQVLEEMQNADQELRERDQLQEDLSAELNARDLLEQELLTLRQAEDQAIQEREQAYAEVDQLSKRLADLEERHRTDADTKRKALEERDDLTSQLRRAKNAREEDVRSLKAEMQSEFSQLMRTIADKEQSNNRLQSDIESARNRISQRDRDINEIQTALHNAESNHRQLGDEHTSDKISSEMEAERLRRNLQRSEADLATAHDDLDRLEGALRERESEIHELINEKRALEQQMTAEGQDRLALSDKLDQAEKAAKQFEALIAPLKQKVEDLQRRLDQDGNFLGASQRRADSGRKDAVDLLHTVYQRINKISGVADVDTPTAFPTLKDKILLRLRAIANSHADFEKQLRSVELRLESKVGVMTREMEAKKRLLDSVEVSVQKMATTKHAWKAKLAMKEDELNDAKARAKDLQSQLSSVRMAAEGDTSKERASLSSRASSAEKRVILLSNQLAELQGQVAEHQTKHSDANSKWEDRVREYEKRLKAANERVKAEKQGGKERARQLEETVKSLQDQIRATNARSDKLQSVLNAANMGSRRHDPDAL